MPIHRPASADADGVITIKEVTTPTAKGDSGQVYTKSDNNLYFQDGAGTEQVLLKGGTRTIWVPASAMRPTASNGCADLAKVETTAGRPDMSVLDFDKDADEHAQFDIAFPKSWNLGTIQFQVYWTGIAATSGVAWGLQGLAVSDNSSIDVAYGTAVVVTDDAQGAVEEVLVTAVSGAVTIAGTPADDDICFFRFFRDISDGNDDMNGDARLLGVKIYYSVDAGNDV